MSGHLRLVLQPIGTANDAHDAQYGDGNSVRRRAVHGWLLQRVDADDTVVFADHPIPGTPSRTLNPDDSVNWGRVLQQGTTALIPFLGDQDATLDADPQGRIREGAPRGSPRWSVM